MINRCVHVIAAILVTGAYAYQIHSGLDMIFAIAGICLSLACLGGGLLVLWVGHWVNSKSTECSGFYLSIATLLYYVSLLAMVLGIYLIWRKPTTLQAALYGGYGFFLAAAIMKARLSHNTSWGLERTD